MASSTSTPPRKRAAPPAAAPRKRATSPAKAAPTARRPRKARTMEELVDEHVARWAREGLLELTGWKGAPHLRTALPSGPDVEFDPARVERVLRFFLILRQLIGRHAGRRFILLDWQVRYLVAPVFGIVDKVTRRRVIRTVWFEIPRKNGKSTLCSGLALYLFTGDSEPGAQVYTAAGDRGQAGIVFGPCRDMAAGSPPLARRLGNGIRRHYLENPHSGSILRALSSDGARQHGLNVHGAIVDEVHVHKSPDLIDALETGVGSRDQPLVIFITTADEGADGSIYATKREYLEGIVGGTIVDRRFLGVVFAADPAAPGFDPFSRETILSANPGTDVTISLEYLEGAAAEARVAEQAGEVLPAGHTGLDTMFAGRPTYGGLDLSSTSDFTAFAFLTQLTEPAPVGDVTADRVPTEGYALHVLHWIPEERAEDLERRTGVPLGRWREDGWLRFTEGNVVDYAQVRADIAAETERLGAVLVEVAYDPWNAAETVNEMQNAGLTMVPLRQGYASLSSPSKELERLVMGSTPDAPLLIHGANPVLRWMADNVEVTQDPGGNIKPTKPDKRKSSKRIDGIAATVNALARAMLRPPPKKPRRSAGF